jgi:hypothetical protein
MPAAIVKAHIFPQKYSELGGLYMLRIRDTELYYIGMARCFYTRMCGHRSKSSLHNTNTAIRSAVEAFGPDCLDMHILAVMEPYDRKLMAEAEQRLVWRHFANPHCLNDSMGITVFNEAV